MVPARGATHMASKLDAGRKVSEDPVEPPPPGEGDLADVLDLEWLVVTAAASGQSGEQGE